MARVFRIGGISPLKKIVNKSNPYTTEVRLRTNYVLIDFLITIETQPASTDVVALEPFDSRS